MKNASTVAHTRGERERNADSFNANSCRDHERGAAMTNHLDNNVRYTVLAYGRSGGSTKQQETIREHFADAMEAERYAAKLRSCGLAVRVIDDVTARAQRARREAERLVAKSQMQPVVTGWRVVDVGDGGRVISPRFTVQNAAEQFAQIARANGRDVAIEPIHGADDAAVGGTLL
jgi:hypothetical protein